MGRRNGDRVRNKISEDEMRKITYFLILVTFLLIFATSCSQRQEESVSTSKTTTVVSDTNEIVETQISTVSKTPTIEVTPTATYTPKKAENFEDCVRLPKFDNAYSDCYGYNIQGEVIT